MCFFIRLRSAIHREFSDKIYRNVVTNRVSNFEGVNRIRISDSEKTKYRATTSRKPRENTEEQLFFLHPNYLSDAILQDPIGEQFASEG